MAKVELIARFIAIGAIKVALHLGRLAQLPQPTFAKVCPRFSMSAIRYKSEFAANAKFQELRARGRTSQGLPGAMRGARQFDHKPEV